MFTSGAPLVFDLVGGGTVIITGFALTGLGPALAQVNLRTDARVASLLRASDGACGITLSGYTAYYLARGMGGWTPLGRYLLGLDGDAWTWTVWATVVIWAVVTVISFGALLRGLSGPPGDRRAVPYGGFMLQLAIFGGLWWWDAFFPVPRWDELLWEAATAGNFFLHCIYMPPTIGAAVGVVLGLCSSIRSHRAARLAERQAEQHNAPMIPANRRATR